MEVRDTGTQVQSAQTAAHGPMAAYGSLWQPMAAYGSLWAAQCHLTYHVHVHGLRAAEVWGVAAKSIPGGGSGGHVYASMRHVVPVS